MTASLYACDWVVLLVNNIYHKMFEIIIIIISLLMIGEVRHWSTVYMLLFCYFTSLQISQPEYMRYIVCTDGLHLFTRVPRLFYL